MIFSRLYHEQAIKIGMKISETLAKLGEKKDNRMAIYGAHSYHQMVMSKLIIQLHSMMGGMGKPQKNSDLQQNLAFATLLYRRGLDLLLSTLGKMISDHERSRKYIFEIKLYSLIDVD